MEVDDADSDTEGGRKKFHPAIVLLGFIVPVLIAYVFFYVAFREVESGADFVAIEYPSINSRLVFVARSHVAASQRDLFTYRGRPPKSIVGVRVLYMPAEEWYTHLLFPLEFIELNLRRLGREP